MAVKQRKNSQKKPRGKGKPFKPNNIKTGEKDPRINRKGRLIPKDQKELNDVIDKIFAEATLGDDGKKIEKLYAAIDTLLLSKNPAGPIHILDRRFGKVKEIVEVGGGDKPLLIKIVHDDKPRIENPSGREISSESDGSDSE